jgi:SEL1 protein
MGWTARKLAFWVAFLVLFSLALSAVAVGAENFDGVASTQNHDVSPSLSPQDAYERAIHLLRMTLDNSKGVAARSRAEARRSRKAGAQKQRSTATAASSAAPPAATAASQSQKKHLSGMKLYWELFKNWLPFTGIVRDITRLKDLLLTFNPFRNANPQAGAPTPGGSRLFAALRSNSISWEGANLLTPAEGFVSGLDPVEQEQARLYPGARPETLWPEWDGGDDAYFGPFLSTTFEEIDVVEGTASHPANTSSNTWDKLSLPGAAARRRKALQLREQADSRRAEAIALLTWAAGWGESDLIAADRDVLIASTSRLDWAHEAKKGVEDEETLIEVFLASNGLPIATNVTRPSSDALWTLAMHSLWGTHGAVPNPARAKACLEKLATFNGNASAHTILGWLEGGAWGSEGWRLMGVEDPGLDFDQFDRQAKALLHYHAAAKSGNSLAQMTLAYRYNAGVGVTSDCGATLFWYEQAAQDALKRFQSGPPGGLTLPYTHLRLSDISGGVFGPGASAASTGMAKYRPAIQAMLHSLPADGSSDGRRLEDLLEFFTYHAQRGEPGYALRLARIYYGGSVLGPSESAARVPRDYKKAREYLMRIVREVWPTDASAVARGGPTGVTAKQGQRGEDVKLKVDDVLAVQAGVAAGLLGRIWLRGEGVTSNFARAWVWFSRGAEQGDAESYNGLGVMYQQGLGVPRNMRKAVEYFEMSSSAGYMSSADGCINLAKLHYQMFNYTQAAKLFDLAVKLGNSFEAYYYLAMINIRHGRFQRDPSNPTAYRVDAPGTASYERCRSAVSGLKFAVERADWSDATFSRAERAWGKGMRGRALLGWSIAGERGFEAAQNNVAWVLDRDKRRLRIDALDQDQQSNATDKLALIHWIRSAAQDNVDALVKMGDYYYYGLGASEASVEKQSTMSPPSTSAIKAPSASYDKAAACYSAAAERQTSALAYWNMGYMYERGLGVPKKDYNLAKRYYDMALELNSEAYLPVLLSLAKLFVMACWDAMTKKDASALNLLNGLAFGPTGRTRILGAMSGGFWDNGELPYTEADEIRIQREREEMVVDRGAGAAANDVAAGDDLGDPNLPETYAARHPNRNANAGTAADDPRTAGPSSNGMAESFDGTIEGLMIMFGLAALAMLVYVRQGVQLRLERQRQERAAAQADDEAAAAAAVTNGRRGGAAGHAGPPEVDPNQPFGWPLQDGNAYAGL